MKLGLHPVSELNAGSIPARRPADAIPCWVKIFGAVAVIVIAIIAGLHLAGSGMGHLAHGDTDIHTAPTGLSRRSP